MEKLRTHVSFKIQEEYQVEIDEWLSHQTNIRHSLNHVMKYIIDKFGMCDITSYDVQKIIHQEIFLKGGIVQVESQTAEQLPPSSSDAHKKNSVAASEESQGGEPQTDVGGETKPDTDTDTDVEKQLFGGMSEEELMDP